MTAADRRARIARNVAAAPRGGRRQAAAWVRTAALVLTAIAIAATAVATPASADIGFPGPSTQGTGGAASGEKPESKLWFNDGRWWASLYHRTSGTYHIFWLDRTAQTWVDTGVPIDNRPSSRADTLWDGSHLYVASAVYASSSTATVANTPTRLYRFSYDPLQKTYTLDPGYPATINTTSSETIVLDKDSTGRLWATWAQGQKVYYNTTTPGDDRSWGTPAVLPLPQAQSLDPDDISSLVAFGTPGDGNGGGRIGVMWSNQTASTTYFSVHYDTDPTTTWQPAEAVTIPGPKQSDDHLNIKDLQTDDHGRVFAVVKTSLDELASAGASAPQIVVAARAAKGGWTRGTFGTVADCHTRPILVLDAPNQLVHVYATAPDGGCPYTGVAGSIYTKTATFDKLSFPSGRGTVVMRSDASPNLNNVSATKQTVDAGTGIVVLASDDVAKQYWTSYERITDPAPPQASFTATPTSGTAPLTVQFTDTSTHSPTSWSWDFGDGATATSQNPSHVYTNPGTYTATLRVSNLSGVTSTSQTTIAVARPSQPIWAVATQTAAATVAGPSVDLPIPSAAAASDVLVATFTVDNAPVVTAPAGWTAIVTGVPSGTGATLYAYYRVAAAGDAGATSSWALSSGQRWSGGITAYRGVDTTHPLDVPYPATASRSADTTTVTVPSITTQTNGAELVGGFGADSTTGAVTPPSGWAENFANPTGQLAESAHRTTGTAGVTGAQTWTLNVARSVGAWMSALRPATPSPATAQSPATLQGVSKVLTFVEENHSIDQSLAGMPYLASLAQRYGYATQYTAVAHPSLPNYLAIAGGDTFGVKDDDGPALHPLAGPSVFGAALANGGTARTYAESMTGTCATTSADPYYVKHDPWAYFVDERAACNALDVPSGTPESGALATDIATNALPNAGMVIPNICDDAHDCPLATADRWLSTWLPLIQSSSDFLSGRLAVVVTSDEDAESQISDYRVLTVVLHASLNGRAVSTPLSHYSLTRLYADVTHTAPLRNAAGAPSLAGAFGLEIASAAAVAAPADQTADEGTPSSFDLGSFAANGSHGPWQVDVDWGDGTSHTTFAAAVAGALGTQQHTYADGPATRTVAVSVRDADGVASAARFSVAVANVAPSVQLAAGNPAVVDAGTTQTLAYAISDPGADAVAAVSTSCGAAGVKVSGSDVHDASSGSFQCTFPDGPATSTVTVAAQDDDGAWSPVASGQVDVQGVAASTTTTSAFAAFAAFGRGAHAARPA